MLRVSRILIAVALTTVAGASLAAASFNTFSADNSRVTKTVVSGHTGTEAKVTVGTTYAFGLEWYEDHDDPCTFVLSGARLEAGSWQEKKQAHKIGNCNGFSHSTIWLKQPNEKWTGEPRFIRSVQVCTSEKSSSAAEKLKGIRVKSARLTDAGVLIKEDATESYQLPHCKTWEAEVACPDGKAVTGMYLQYNTTSYRGIALDCAPVVTSTQRPPAQP